MALLENDPNASDPSYINVQKDIFWLDPPDLARKHVEELYELTHDVLDKKFTNQCKHNFHSCYSEMYFAATFRIRCGFAVTHPSDRGPDFFLTDSNSWAEIVSATDGEVGNPNSISSPIEGELNEYPEAKIILRLTSAFETKALKMKSDIEKGIIKASQPIIVCISGGGLKEKFPIYQTGGYPQIVKALLPVGDIVYWKNPQTGKLLTIEHQFREGVNKITSNGHLQINTNPFLKEEYSHISCVIYSLADPGNPLDKDNWGNDFFTIHNPMAQNPIPTGFINCGHEYTVSVSKDHFDIDTFNHKSS